MERGLTLAEWLKTRRDPLGILCVFKGCAVLLAALHAEGLAQKGPGAGQHSLDAPIPRMAANRLWYHGPHWCGFVLHEVPTVEQLTACLQWFTTSAEHLGKFE